jgi:cytochrome c peroxidase
MLIRGIMNKVYKYIALFALFIAVAACKKDDAPQDQLTAYKPELPVWVPEMTLDPANPLTKEGIMLGRKLYFDPLLSKDGPLDGKSCSSCHNPEFGFASFTLDPGRPVMPHVNMSWQQFWLWDGAFEGTVEDVMLMEVADFFQAKTQHLNANAEYRKEFKKVFGIDQIDHLHVAYAISQFFRSLTSFNSPFDRAFATNQWPSQSALRGFDLFFSEKAECFHCHHLGFFTDFSFHNNGLEPVYEGVNKGRELVTGKIEDRGKFKTPTLRNVAVRSPYMHDGRFTTLRQVIDHYNTGLNFNEYLDLLLTHNSSVGIRLSQQDINDLIAFLETLTDDEFINNAGMIK